MSGVIARRAEEIHEELDAESQDASRELFARLVAANAGSVVRRPCRRSELSDHAATVADRYVSARLLVADRDSITREPTIEIAHDALLAAWPRLGTWVRNDQRWIALLGTITSSTRVWQEGGRGGVRTCFAAPDSKPPSKPSPRDAIWHRHRARVRRGEPATSRRRDRRRPADGADVCDDYSSRSAVVLVVAIVAGAVAVVQRGRAQHVLRPQRWPKRSGPTPRPPTPRRPRRARPSPR